MTYEVFKLFQLYYRSASALPSLKCFLNLCLFSIGIFLLHTTYGGLGNLYFSNALSATKLFNQWLLIC